MMMKLTSSDNNPYTAAKQMIRNVIISPAGDRFMGLLENGDALRNDNSVKNYD